MTKEITQSTTQLPATLCNIDLLRGLAALAILFWHYQHFYFPRAGVNDVASQRTEQPLFDAFAWLYLHGDWAVQFFWILSGFIFFHVYAQRRDVGLWAFFANRLSRLYPLHFITLIAVAGIQLFSLILFGHFQIYPFNDLWHFVLNLFMASHWGLQEGYSFNGPIWSISVEVVVYAAFLLYLKKIGISLISGILFLGFAVLFYAIESGPISACAVFFSLGGVVNRLQANFRPDFSLAAGLFLLVLAGVLIKLGFGDLRVIVCVGIFPALIWLAAALDAKGASSGGSGLWLGSITYSTYLLHVPMQMVAIMVLDGVFGGRDVVSSPYFLSMYLFGVVGVAALTYKFVEHPLKNRFRKLLLR